MIGRENNEKSFDNHNTGGTPYISLSPSNQTKLETGSVGNSPRKKPSSLKHPLISKKSPLFKKFGLDAVFMNQNNSNMGFSDGYEAYLQERKQEKSATPPLESETRNIKQRVHMHQMREKHLDVKRANGSENNAPNSHFNTSLSNINEKKASESFTFYSAKKTNHTPRGSVLSKAALDIYNSEPHLTSESAIAWSQSMINAAKVRAVNTKENLPIVKVHDSKPPQSILSQNHNMISSNLRQPTLPQKSGLLKNNNPVEDNSQNENNMGPVKETAQVEFRRKIVQQAKKVVFSSKVITGSIKDGLVNESINSLELSAIQDVNDKDILNISRDDALLQYIDKSQAEQEGLDKLPKHPLKLLKQLTSDFSITNGENIGSNRSNKKSNSLSDLGSPKQLVQVEEIVSTQLSHSIMKKETESKPFIYSNQLRGRKMQARSFIIEDSTTKATDRNHDRNSSMHEIQK